MKRYNTELRRFRRLLAEQRTLGRVIERQMRLLKYLRETHKEKA